MGTLHTVCPALDGDFDLVVDDFYKPFSNTPAMIFFHDTTTRWGRTNDVPTFMTGTEEERREYVEGLVLSSFTVVLIIVVWMLILSILKCLGYKRVGGWSGRLAPLPPSPLLEFQDENLISDNKKEELDKWRHDFRKRKLYLRVSR